MVEIEERGEERGDERGDVGANANYLSFADESVISSILPCLACPLQHFSLSPLNHYFSLPQRPHQTFLGQKSVIS